MTEDIDKIKRELEEVRRLKEELRREVEETRRDREEALRREKEELRAERERERERVRRDRHPSPPRAPRAPRRVRPVRDIDIDLSGITDSLEDMMDGLGKSIEMSLKDVEGIGKNFRIPSVRIHKAGRKGRRIRKSDIEKIPPERVAKIVAPLGSEERLRILEFLKAGGQNFKDIENATQKYGSSLTHHLNPLVDAGYVVKGEVRGMYYLTVEGRLAYRLSQWLTHRVESQRLSTGSNGEVTIDFDEDADEKVVIVEDEAELAKAAEHLERVASEIENAQDAIEDAADEIEDAKDEEHDRLEELEEERERLEEERERLEEERLERLEELDEEDVDDADDLDDLDWED